MHKSFLMLVTATFGSQCVAAQAFSVDDGIKAEKASDETVVQPAVSSNSTLIDAPARAETQADVLNRLPPDEIMPFLFPKEFKELVDAYPIRVGMSKAKVQQAIRDHQDRPITREKIFLAGATANDLPEKPLLMMTDGRYEFVSLVFFKDGKVESIWCIWGRPGLASGPVFVLDGDIKPRKAVQQVFLDRRYSF